MNQNPMFRHVAALLALATALLLPLIPAGASQADPARKTRHVVLVTLDGVRTQDLFGGMDPVIIADPEGSGIYDEELTRRRYWRDSAQARREVLMPRFWSEMAPQGMLLGNRDLGSRVSVSNDQWFSYPGYSEMLTGRPQPHVTSNDLVRYPVATVMDHVADKLDTGFAGVAQIGSWDGFRMAASKADGGFLMSGAYDDIPGALSTPEMDRYSALRRQIQQLWEEGSNDTTTFLLGRDYLLRHQPALLWIGLSQSDDWAHARRYDLLLDYLHLVDGWLADLWQLIEETPGLAGQTTLILTTDHGRGPTPEDWAEHGAEIAGCDAIWLFVRGPDTPAVGQVQGGPELFQGTVATTVLQLLGLDWREFNPEAAPPVPGVTGKAE